VLKINIEIGRKKFKKNSYNLNNYINYMSKNIVDCYFDEENNTVEKIKEEKNYIVGIDLGTTNSSVAIWKDNKVEIIPDEYGNRSIPSIVAMTDYSCYIGYEAKEQKEINPNNVFYEVKRLIGKKYKDETVQNDLQFFSFGIGEDDNGNVIIIPKLKNGKKYNPEQIIAKILISLRNNVKKYLNIENVKAVISVPAYFTDSQRQATKDASAIAGIECVRIMSEPIASALAYGIIDKKIKDETDINNEYIIVYDFGGGTLDVSLLKITKGFFEVMASSGNTHLGGADFDNRILLYCISQFKNDNNIKEIEMISAYSIHKLKKSCEKAKKNLSENNISNILIKNFYDNKDLKVILTNEKFYEICNDLFILCLKPLEDVLTSCCMKKEEINYIILVGGMTRIPLIKKNIKKFFDKEPYCNINPEDTVAIGASIQGYILANHDIPFSDSITLLDSTPLSLGIETSGGIMDVLIPRNTPIPISKKRLYTTDTDDVETIEIKVFEGERLLTKDNFKIGEFILNDLSKLPKGIPKIEVRFSIDLNGIVSISAEEIKLDGIGNKKSIKITDKKDRLSNDEIKKLIEDAKETEELDRLERRHQKSINILKGICGNVIYSIHSEDCKLKQEDKDKIEKEINEIVFVDLSTDDIENLISKTKIKYGVLTLPVSKSTNEIQSSEKEKSDVNCTSVFNDDIDVELTEKQIKELKEIEEARDELVELCYGILNLFKNEENEIKDYIDDVLLWIHVMQKPNINLFKEKIKEVDDKCHEIINEKQTNVDMQKNIEIEQLEHICLSIKASINSNLFSNKENNIKDLEKYIDDTLEWLLDDNNTLEMIQEKILYINSKCNELYDELTKH